MKTKLTMMLAAALICAAGETQGQGIPQRIRTRADAIAAIAAAKAMQDEARYGYARRDYGAEMEAEDARRADAAYAAQERRRIAFEMERQRQEMEAIRREQQRQIDLQNAAYNSRNSRLPR